jgi:hypothetical protein
MSISPSVDKKFRAARIWSNRVLKTIAPHCKGDVINVSAWKDEDKEGDHYKNYFSNASSYVISNYKSEARGFQGVENEFFLDLTIDLAPELHSKFDVVYNHTSLEHIFEVDKAFQNLCLMSKDLVIVVVPFMQEMHGDYGDYWRFTPLCLSRLYKKNNTEMIYCNFNNEPNTSVYILAVGSKNPAKWKNVLPDINKPGLGEDKKNDIMGYNVIRNKNRFGF